MSAGAGAVVVGTGFGARVHVPALRAAGFDVQALVGVDPSRTERRAHRLGVPHATTSLREALSLPGIEAVTIATPPRTHRGLAVTVVEAGRHVICEKPFALDAVEAEAMVGAATRAGVTALVGHEFRWATDRAAAGRAIADGRIGEPRLAAFVHHSSLVAAPDTRVPNWWFDAAAGGGWLGASGAHAVDQVRVWLGDFASVSATLGHTAERPPGAADDSFTVRFRLVSGVDGILQQTAGAWGPSAEVARVVGTGGTVWLEHGAAWLADATGVCRLPVPHDLVLPAPPAPSSDASHRFTHLELGPYTRLCEALRGAVEGRPADSPVPVPTFADGLACMRVLDAVRASAAAGGRHHPCP